MEFRRRLISDGLVENHESGIMAVSRLLRSLPAPKISKSFSSRPGDQSARDFEGGVHQVQHGQIQARCVGKEGKSMCRVGDERHAVGVKANSSDQGTTEKLTNVQGQNRRPSNKQNCIN